SDEGGSGAHAGGRHGRLRAQALPAGRIDERPAASAGRKGTGRMIRKSALRFPLCLLGLCILCTPGGMAAHAQENPLGAVNSLVRTLQADTAQFRWAAAPSELWPIEQSASTPYDRALSAIARAVVLYGRPDISSSIIVLDRAINLLDGGAHQRTLACAFFCMGRAELVRNNVAGAIAQYERALHITVRHPYPELEAKLQSDIGG